MMINLPPAFVKGVNQGAYFAIGFLGVVSAISLVSHYGSKWYDSYNSTSSDTKEVPVKVFKTGTDSLTFTDEFKELISQADIKVKVDKKNNIQSIITDCRDWKLPQPTLSSSDIERK